MPIYEYECNACGNRFERRQSVTDEPVRECPTCGGKTRKVLHPVGVIFKGSGWYLTDNRKSDSNSGGSSGNSSSSSSGSSTTSSSGSESSGSNGTSTASTTAPAAAGAGSSSSTSSSK